MFGTLAEGGEFESIFVRLNWYRDGRPVGTELFELEDLERARARFEALRPDPDRMASLEERTAAAFEARDWAALRALASPEFTFADRRKDAQLAGDVELWIRNLEGVRSWPGRQTKVDVVGRLGSRVAISRIRYTGGADGSVFEGEFLRLVEGDAEGRLRACLHFEPDDRRAAFAEAQARFVAGEAGGDDGQAAIAALGDAVTRHDWEAVRRCFTADGATLDHRTLGLDAFRADEWVESLRAFADLAPDVSVEPFAILAWNDHGRVSLTRVVGTQRSGGAFENVFVGVAMTRGDRIARFEFFDAEDAGRALARFEELCAEIG
jgi:hypothetical protein